MAQKILIFLALVGAVCADIARLTTCSDVNQDACTVSQLRISPCRSKTACILQKGTNTSMSFDYTPNYVATKLKTAVFWADTTLMFEELGLADGCLYTKCPVESGQQQTFDYTLHVGKKLPNGKYVFRWVLYNEENEEQKCCFKTTIQIRK